MIPGGVLVTLLTAGTTLGSVLLARWLIGVSWNVIARAHPVREPGVGAERRRFQSFACGLVNMGLSVDVTTDETHLHLRPQAFIRWFGAKPASIPWSAIEPRPRKAGRRITSVMIEGKRLDGPAWCFERLERGVS